MYAHIRPIYAVVKINAAHICPTYAVKLSKKAFTFLLHEDVWCVLRKQ
jgi:hypothetical protein